MDFIEQWFRVSPDGGNGTLEVVYLVVLGLGVVLAARRVRLRRARRDRRD
jgi:hypothetical protein